MGLVKAQFSIVTITFQTNLGLSTFNSKNLIIERCRQLLSSNQRSNQYLKILITALALCINKTTAYGIKELCSMI